MATNEVSVQTGVSDIPLPEFKGPNDVATQADLSSPSINLSTRTSVQRLLNNQLSNRPGWQTPQVQRMYSNFTYGGNYRMGGTQGTTDTNVETPIEPVTTPAFDAETGEAEVGASMLETASTGPAILASIGGQAIGEGISAISQIAPTQIEQQQTQAHNSGTEMELNTQLANAKTISSDASVGASIGGIVPIIGAPIGATIGSIVGAATTGDITGADLSSPEEDAQL